jgi:hypothetical protein
MTSMVEHPHIFYVYEHWRPDTGVCFYVGKGKGKRAWDLKNMRNPHYKSIVSKLTSAGMSVDVRIIISNVSNETALAVEKDRIAFYGIKNLSNMTLGGDGLSNPSPEIRLKISLSQKKRFENIEARKKLSDALKGRVISKETKKKLSISSRGRKHSDEVREKMRSAAKGREIPLCVREAQRLAVTGRKRAPFTEQTLRKMSEAAKVREANKRARAS